MQSITKRGILLVVAVGLLGFLAYQPVAAEPPAHAKAKGLENGNPGPPEDVNRGPSENRSDTANGAVFAEFDDEPISAILNTDDEDTLTVVVKINRGEPTTSYQVSVAVACMMPSTVLGQITTNPAGIGVGHFQLDLTQNANFDPEAEETCIQVFVNTSASEQVEVPLKPEDDEEEA